MSSQQQQKTSILSSVARMARAHHEAANGAFVALHGDPRLVSQSSAQSKSAHAQTVQANWTVQRKSATAATTTTHVKPNKYSYPPSSSYSYSSGSSSTESLAKAPVQETRNNSVDSSSSKKSARVWQSVKKAAREHHEAVTGAYVAYYGIGSPVPSASRRTSAVPSQ